MKKTFSSPPVKDADTVSRYGMQRRNMLKFMGASAAVITIGTACNKHDNPDGGVNLGTGDFGVLNYAYALEQLEAAFYIKVSQSTVAGLSAQETLYLNDIMKHEVIHRDFFKTALGSNAIAGLEVDFSSINFSDRTSVLTAARDFEDTGVSAYNGAGKLIADPQYLVVAGQIVSVEARHASAIRDMLSPGSFAATTDANGLDLVRTPSQVLTIIAPFVKTKINASGLPTS